MNQNHPSLDKTIKIRLALESVINQLFINNLMIHLNLDHINSNHNLIIMLKKILDIHLVLVINIIKKSIMKHKAWNMGGLSLVYIILKHL